MSRLVERHPIVIYTLARLGLFVAAVIPLHLIGFRGLLLLALALLVSGALSLVLLNGVRSRFSGSLAGYFARLNKRIDDATRAEDEDEDGAPADADAPAMDLARDREAQAEAQPGQQQR